MFSKPEMVRKELYCTKSIISKFAVHRHYSTLGHKGNTLQEYRVGIKYDDISVGKTYTSQAPAGSELRSAAKTHTQDNREQQDETTQMLASCRQGVCGTRTEDLSERK